MLAFLLAHGDEPLVLDQPEDDLDNQIIYSLVVTQMREDKLRRQIIVVTHNPNIVVTATPRCCTFLISSTVSARSWSRALCKALKCASRCAESWKAVAPLWSSGTDGLNPDQRCLTACANCSKQSGSERRAFSS